MRKAYEPNPKRKSKNISIVTVISVIFICYFFYTLIQQQYQINKYDSQIQMYQGEIQNKNKLTKYYGEQKLSIQTDEYMESVAREELGYVKPYEKVFIDANK
jgi:cell division protein FtsB